MTTGNVQNVQLDRCSLIPITARAFILSFLGFILSAPPTCCSGLTISRKPATTTNSCDACQTAVRHYEMEDIAGSQIVKLFQQMEQTGDARGTMWVARLYFKGRCSLPEKPDIAQAKARVVIDEIVKLAEKADVQAEFLLGSAYQEGLGVDEDQGKAIQWYTKAAAAGQVTAINNLGIMFALGHGTEPDITKARQLFARAAGLGSKLAAQNVAKYQERGGSSELSTLRENTLVQALGLQENAAIAFLATNGLISDPKAFTLGSHKHQKQYFFRKDGIVFNVDINGRVVDVEGHAEGSRGSSQFKGPLPFGLNWKDTAESTQELLGIPYDSGDVADDHAYGMAYQMKNVSFSVMFTYEGEKKVKLWRVFERWAVKYPAPESPDDSRPNSDTACLFFPSAQMD